MLGEQSGLEGKSCHCTICCQFGKKLQFCIHFDSISPILCTSHPASCIELQGLGFAEAELQKKLDANGSLHFGYSRTNYLNIQITNNKIDKLLCPFGEKPPIDVVVLGQGCDAVDQNCDCNVDDCSEDKVPPTISLKLPIPTTPFQSTDEAQAFLDENVDISDDCAAELTRSIKLLNQTTCTECTFEVTVKDERCANATDPPLPDTPGKPITVELFVLEVDSTAAEITCGFFLPQDKKHLAWGRHDRCAPPAYPEKDDILHIDLDSHDEKALIDVKFWYQIEVSCLALSEFNLQSYFSQFLALYRLMEQLMLMSAFSATNWRDVVHVSGKKLWVSLSSVKTNPVSYKGPRCISLRLGKSLRCSLYPFARVKTCDAIHNPRLYAIDSCQDHKHRGVVCDIEDNYFISTRFYDIEITATDLAGNVSNETCSVAVIPRGHYGRKSSKSKGSRALNERSKSSKGGSHDADDLRKEFQKSTQRYCIADLSLVWDPELNTKLIEPPLPPDASSSSKGCSSKGSSFALSNAQAPAAAPAVEATLQGQSEPVSLPTLHPHPPFPKREKKKKKPVGRNLRV